MSNTTTTVLTSTTTTTVPPHILDDDGMSGGSVFCLIFFLVACAYFGGGILLRKFLRGAEGYEMIPHFSFWVDLPSLVRDGVAFAWNGCQPVLSYDRI